MGVGDVGPYHEPLDRVSRAGQTGARHGRRALRALREGLLRPRRDAGPLGRALQPTATGFASLIADCGFNVVSIAGNKAMDWGAEAMLDMIELLNSLGIQTVGGGRNEEHPRRPAVFSKNRTSVAFLAYSSCSRGIRRNAAPGGHRTIRVDTFYKPEDWQPGRRRVSSRSPGEGPGRDVPRHRGPRKLAGAVVVSMHWGIHNIPRMLADYQRTVSGRRSPRALNLILGHHPHIPKGIEVINGPNGPRACFYSLSHFIWTPAASSALTCRGTRAGGTAEKGRCAARSGLPPLADGARRDEEPDRRAVITPRGHRTSRLPSGAVSTRGTGPRCYATVARASIPAVEHLDWCSEDLRTRSPSTATRCSSRDRGGSVAETRDMYDFHGKVALVTGTSRRRGIGCAIALRLHRSTGPPVVVNDPGDRAARSFAPWEWDGGRRGLPSIVEESRSSAVAGWRSRRT